MLTAVINKRKKFGIKLTLNGKSGTMIKCQVNTSDYSRINAFKNHNEKKNYDQRNGDSFCICIDGVTMWNVQNTAQATSEMNAKVRTVEMSKYDDINEQSMFESFDEHTITTGDNGFDIVAKKNLVISI